MLAARSRVGRLRRACGTGAAAARERTAAIISTREDESKVSDIDRHRGAARFAVVVPVKSGATMKSRLQAPAGITRAELARAIAVDTLRAVARTPLARLVVVTSDPVVAEEARSLGAPVEPDPGGGLNAALAAGARLAASSRPQAGEGVAALLGDLPCLTPRDLTAALQAAAAHPRAFVPDLEGTGTVLLTDRSEHLTARFGPGSAAAHSTLAARLDLDLPRLRRDIDTADDLRAAQALGLGRHTRELLAQAGELAC